jgi:hypothetical protein
MSGMLSTVPLSSTTPEAGISGNSTRLRASGKRGRIPPVELSLSYVGSACLQP